MFIEYNKFYKHLFIFVSFRIGNKEPSAFSKEVVNINSIYLFIYFFFQINKQFEIFYIIKKNVMHLFDKFDVLLKKTLYRSEVEEHLTRFMDPVSWNNT